MDIISTSKDLENKVLNLAKEMDYDQRVLFILKNLGPKRFTDLEYYCDISRSTLSKYLKLLLERYYIEKKIFDDNKPRYFITERGTEKIQEESFSLEENLLYIDRLNENISKLTSLISFYREIGVADLIISQIVQKISKIGIKFYDIEQNDELYLAMFYIFLNSVLTRDYKFEINEFCKHYGVKKLRIEFYVDKIMSNKLGFYMFVRGEDIFFFHEEDILGITALRLIKDRLIDEIIQKNLSNDKELLDLDRAAAEIVDKLIKMDLIWDRIIEPFEILIEKMLIKIAIEMGIPKPTLMDIALQSEKIAKSKGGISSLINIIEGSDRYEDLNLVSISEYKEIDVDEVLEKIRGFCPECGKTILRTDLSNICSRCDNKFQDDSLLTKIDEANEKSMRYKKESLKLEVLIECPNCNYSVKPYWDVCPHCSTPIRKE
ncbi:MAG: hypothetical protein ACFFA6_09545 [Promethearchaeota archaeon]